MEKQDNVEKVTDQLEETKEEIMEESNPLASLSADQIQAVIAAYEAEKTKSEQVADPDLEDPTKVSRDLKIVSDKRYGMVKFKREGGGHVPTILKGDYDSLEKAERDLNLYTSGLLKPTPMKATNIHADVKQVQEDEKIKELRAELEEMKKLMNKDAVA